MKCHPILRVSELDKRYVVRKMVADILRHPMGKASTVNAVSRVTFDVYGGEILGVIGPNGAGKTTLLRIVADLLDPERGYMALGNQDYRSLSPGIRARIGYASSDERSFFWRISGRHNLEFFAGLYGLHSSEAQLRIDELIDYFGLAGSAEAPFYTYSSGTRKKYTLIRAIVHSPQVVVMDELTNSLDPLSADNAKQLVKQYISSDRSRVGLWSSHRLEEIQELCDRVLVMNQGGVQYLGPVDGYDLCCVRNGDGSSTN